MRPLLAVVLALVLALVAHLAQAAQVYEWDAVCIAPNTIVAPQECVPYSSVVVRAYLSDAYVPGTLVDSPFGQPSPLLLSIAYMDTTITTITNNPQRVVNVPRDMDLDFMLPANGDGMGWLIASSDCCILRVNLFDQYGGDLRWGQEGCYGPGGPPPFGSCSTNGYEANAVIVHAGFVPEPGTLALLLGVGVPAVGARMWRRRRDV